MASANVEVPLTRTFPAIFDANGVATVRVGPNSPATMWRLEQYSVITDGTTFGVIFTLYRGDPAGNDILDTTRKGSRATSGQNNVKVGSGTAAQYVTAEWQGDPSLVGTQARFTVNGTETQYRNRV